MTGLPRIFSSASATGRAAKSAWPPAGNGTIMVMLREGYGAPCAKAELESTAGASGNAAATFNNSRRFIGSLSYPLFENTLAKTRRVGKAQRAHLSLSEQSFDVLHVPSPIRREHVLLNKAMKAAMRPIADAADITMLHRVEVNVVNMPPEIGITPDGVLQYRRCQMP